MVRASQPSFLFLPGPGGLGAPTARAKAEGSLGGALREVDAFSRQESSGFALKELATLAVVLKRCEQLRSGVAMVNGLYN